MINDNTITYDKRKLKRVYFETHNDDMMMAFAATGRDSVVKLALGGYWVNNKKRVTWMKWQRPLLAVY